MATLSDFVPSDVPTDVLGGVGLTHLKVYEDRKAPDGQYSGCAHVHAITDEAYFVVGGEGFLELHDIANGFRRVPLRPGAYVQFTPGTIHRVVSTGGLEVVVVIGNAGLAERGDARIYFGPDVDADPDAYRRLAALPKTDGLKGALDRRDASVAGYAKLMALHEADPVAYRAEVTRFVRLHFREMAALRDAFSSIVDAGPARWTAIVRHRLDALPDSPADAETVTASAEGEPVLGMCGMLRPVSGLSALAGEADAIDIPRG